MRVVPPRTTMHLRAVVLPDDVERDLFVVNGHLTFVEPDDAVTVFTDGFVLPGLVDAHVHLSSASPAGDAAPDDVRVRASAGTHLDAGVLLVREVGSASHASIGLGPDDGVARVRSSGRCITPDRLAFVEHEVRAGGGWACVTGGIAFGDLRDAVARAHAIGGRVAAHVTRARDIDAAIDANVDSIEHGWEIAADHVGVMCDRGIAFVPTLAAFAGHADVVGRAADAGVDVIAGSDGGAAIGHGRVADEVVALVGAGVPLQQALGAASWTARRFLGIPGIEEGAPADLVAYRDDPRAEPSALGAPLVRVLDGRLFV